MALAPLVSMPAAASHSEYNETVATHIEGDNCAEHLASVHGDEDNDGTHGHGAGVFRVHLNVAELQFNGGATGFHWEGNASVGRSRDRLILASKAEGSFDVGIGHGDVQMLYGRAIAPGLTALAGMRRDIGAEARDNYAAIGFAAEPWPGVDVKCMLFLSEQRDVTGRFEIHADHSLGAGFALQPTIEIDLSANDRPARHRGAGLTTAEAGLRLRYEFGSGLSPYVGFAWHSSFGATRHHQLVEGEDVASASFVLGMNVNF